MPEIVAWTTPDILDLSGLSERRLNYLCTSGVFGERNQRPGSGARRSFTDEDLFVAQVIAKLAVLGGRLLSTSHFADGCLGRDIAAEVSEAIRDRRGRWLIVTDSEVATSDEIVGEAAVILDLDAVPIPWEMA